MHDQVRLALAIGLLSLIVLGAGRQGLTAETRLSVQLSSEVSYGEDVYLQITLSNNTGRVDWETPVVPAAPGLRFGALQGPSQSSSIEIVNGKRSATYSFSYALVVRSDAGRTGTFEIGPVRVLRKNAPPLTSRKLSLSVNKRPDLGVEVGVEASPSSGPVGAPTRVVYTIQFPKTSTRRRTRFSLFDSDDGPKLRQLYIPILENADLKFTPVAVDGKKRQYTARLGDTELIYQDGFTTKSDGTAYAAFTFAFDVIPRKTGKFELGGANATMLLPTGRFQRTVFGDSRAERRQYSGAAPSLSYEAYALPSNGQPPGFTGAVGRFEITVATKDTKVNAFDPIALEVRVRGQGLLEDLAAPDWSQVPSITQDFKVSADVHTGDLQGDSKVFQQVIRAIHADVNQIPALPFPYYDPWTRQYAIAYSKPIPIEVAAVHTVGASDAIGRKNPAVPLRESTESIAPAVTKNLGFPPNARELGASAPSLASGRQFIGPAFFASAFAPPILFFGWLLVRRAREQDPAVRARQRALASAKTAIANAGGDLDAVSAAYQDYFRHRFGLPDGELTSTQLRETLGAIGADDDLTRRAVDGLEQLLASRFGAASGSADSIAQLAPGILTELDALQA